MINGGGIGWGRAVIFVFLGAVGLAASGACTDAGPEQGPAQPVATVRAPLVTSDGCTITGEQESLPWMAHKCAAAMGNYGNGKPIEVTGFNCNDGVEVPDTHPNGGGFPFQVCDRPNVLNGECDPGSRFQVLVDTENTAKQRVTIVAHCRHRNKGTDYGDVAVIAHNFGTGDTCFFQDKNSGGGTLPSDVPAPKDDYTNKFWGTPAATAAIRCVQCHDNGPFIRSPYLTQLKGTPRSEARFIEDNPIIIAQAQAAMRSPKAYVPGSRDSNANRDQPYRFVGNDFQGWKAYAVSVQATQIPGLSQNQCTSCHRLGVSTIEAGGAREWQINQGTASKMGELATAAIQEHKNPHTPAGADNFSPIWMLPVQSGYSESSFQEYRLVKACAKAIYDNAILPTGCGYTQFAQGDTCSAPALSTTVNGATVGPVTTDPEEIVVDVPVGGDVAFGGWASLHGPFYQTSVGIPYGSPGFEGTSAQLVVTGSPPHYQVRAGRVGRPGVPGAGAGGKVEFTRYSEIRGVDDPSSCAATPNPMRDFDGVKPTLSIDVDTGQRSLTFVTGFIGSVSPSLQALFGLTERSSVTSLQKNAPVPVPMAGSAWTSRCAGYTPVYSVNHRRTYDDVELVASPNASKHRCLLTGIGGDWLHTDATGAVQPFAEIYQSGGAIRMRVRSPLGTNMAYAEASCIQIQP